MYMYDRQIDMQTDRQTDRQTYRLTDTLDEGEAWFTVVCKKWMISSSHTPTYILYTHVRCHIEGSIVAGGR